FIRNVGASRANSGSRDGLKATLSLKSRFPGVRCVDFSSIDDVIAIWDKAMCLWTKAGVRRVDFSSIDDVIAIWDKAMCLWTKAGESCCAGTVINHYSETIPVMFFHVSAIIGYTQILDIDYPPCRSASGCVTGDDRIAN
nr:hypothetical protein [Tanacetum cinerariifolium]